MSTEKKVFAGAVIVIGFIIVGALWSIAVRERGTHQSIQLAETNCSFGSNAGSAAYSATIVSKNNYDATVNAVKALIAKYNGITSSWNTSNVQYQTGPYQNNYIYVTSTNISAMIDLNDGNNFMNDLQETVATSGSLESPNYNETSGAQLNQYCIDDLNSIHEQESFLALYWRELPLAIKNYVPAATDTASYGNSNQDTIDALSQQIQNAYNNIGSSNDNAANLMQCLNKMTVNLSINAADQPTIYYPAGPSGAPASNQ